MINFFSYFVMFFIIALCPAFLIAMYLMIWQLILEFKDRPK